ncbi:hypothetical protein SAMD00019534_048800 [Acytostelium subglobosum LB1]|uniref:hypothetical protein n=1 Tax=Acytostelium subglobosum LB1 TaxID=1410327 RepID=UPI0006450AD5|nr:hypothetical protein SAMD00019534_048800 [Acytostelium subglobosum LB1]GAM21705.1 hypothetical protein SAMD00019534_048800 [Acytostelium subglobosum LB1]|eukprot:XP_012755824.1 hypothetical protein SAMD00019534_048800 [Acytostelium subglobosum LB1]
MNKSEPTSIESLRPKEVVTTGNGVTGNGVPKPTFTSLAERRAAALKKRQDEADAKQKESQKQSQIRLHNLFADDDDLDGEVDHVAAAQEKLINVNPNEYFAQQQQKSSSVSSSKDNDRDRGRDGRWPSQRGDDRRDGRRDDRRDDRDNRDNRRDDRRGGGAGGGDRRDNRDNRYDRNNNNNNRRDDRDNNNNRDRRDNRDNRDNNNRDRRDYRDLDSRREDNNRKDIDDKRVGGGPTVGQSEVGEKRTREEESEINDIKKEYYGEKKDRKKKPKKSERTRFVFEWDTNEDTSNDYNSLYSKKQEAKPQFGRGVLAGFDNDASRTNSERERDLPPTHWSKKELKTMNERDWRIFREDFNITTKGSAIPNPMRRWRESVLPGEILEAIAKLGYEKPTPIQMQAIPIALSGRDILGIAETGSGKTAAFVIPMLTYISKQPRMTKESEAEGPYALVMAPTRELAQQIEKETRNFANFFGFRTVALVGGLPIEDQVTQLSKGCEIVIATPGRLNDCLDKRYLVLNQCNYVVLDEADMMIDLGFEQQVTSVLDSMPSSFLKSENEEEAEKQENDSNRIYRTTILYSATMPPKVERLSRKYLRRAVHVIIGEAGKAVDRIKQNVVFVKNDNDKRNQLIELLTNGPPPPIIVFVNKKKHCETISSIIEECNMTSTALHSSRTQEQREMALEGFKKRRFNVLIATDVASRGIHVEGVTHVINYDMPNNIQDYTHRIGRTGRAGLEGMASSFLTDKDTEIMYDLKNMLSTTHNTVPNELMRHPASQIKPGSVTERQKRSETIIYTK